MDISAPSYLSSVGSLLTVGAVALAPLTAPPAAPDLRLAVSATDIGTAVDGLQAALLDGTSHLAAAAGVPGQGLIGVVDNIVTMWDVLFNRLADNTTDPTLLGSLAILQPFCVDAFAMLAHNLGRINGVITGTTAQVGELLATALTGSLRNVLVAGVAAVNAPLAPESYAVLLAAGVEAGELIVGNGLGVVRAVGDAGFDIGGVVVDELTFQLDNALGSLGKLLTQLGDASGSGLAKVVVAAVRGLVFAPALAVLNFGSRAIKTVIATTQGVFDAVVSSGTTVTGQPSTTSAAAAIRAERTAPRPKSPAKKPAPRKASATAAATRSPATGHSGRNAHRDSAK